MKTVDYINTLIKEKELLKEDCKAHAETIRKMKREIGILKDSVLRRDRKIEKLESEASAVNTSSELEIVKNELDILKGKYAELQCEYDKVLEANTTPNIKPQKNNRGESGKLRSDYNALKRKYEEVLKENEELKSIFDEIEQTCDSN